MAYGSVNVPGNLSGKQDLITGAPGQAFEIGADGKAAARDGWSSHNLLLNLNLLDNWYFADPINQRGKTEEFSTGEHIVDRWWSYGGVNPKIAANVDFLAAMQGVLL